MRKQKTHPLHPGRILSSEFMEPLNLSNADVARATGLTEVHIGNIIRGKRNISAETALRLQAAFGVSAGAWLNMQMLYDLEVAEAEDGKTIAKTTQRIKMKAVAYSGDLATA